MYFAREIWTLMCVLNSQEDAYEKETETPLHTNHETSKQFSAVTRSASVVGVGQ